MFTLQDQQGELSGHLVFQRLKRVCCFIYVQNIYKKRMWSSKVSASACYLYWPTELLHKDWTDIKPLHISSGLINIHHYKDKAIIRITEMPVIWDTAAAPWLPKTKICKLFKNLYMLHTFWSCLIRCINIKWIQWELEALQSGQGTQDWPTDGGTEWNQFTHQQLRCARGITNS